MSFQDWLAGAGGLAEGFNALTGFLKPRPPVPDFNKFRTGERPEGSGPRDFNVDADTMRALGIGNRTSAFPSNPTITDVARTRFEDAGRQMDAQREMYGNQKEAFGISQQSAKNRDQTLGKFDSKIEDYKSSGDKLFNDARGNVDEAKQQADLDKDMALSKSVAMLQHFNTQFGSALQRVKDTVGEAQRITLDQATRAMTNLSAAIKSQFDQQLEQVRNEAAAMGDHTGHLSAREDALRAASAREHGNALMQLQSQVVSARAEQETQLANTIASFEATGQQAKAQMTAQASSEMGADYRAHAENRVRIAEMDRTLTEMQTNERSNYLRARESLASMGVQYGLLGDKFMAEQLSAITPPYFAGVSDILESLMGMDLQLMAQEYGYELGDYNLVQAGLEGISSGLHDYRASNLAQKQLDIQRDASRYGMFGDVANAGVNLFPFDWAGNNRPPSTIGVPL